jgi:two-component system, chemotaxis family, chemotaxis protein CheY
MRSLIAEDEPTSQRILTTGLGKYGECDLVENGRDAVEAVKTAVDAGTPYDLVCLDILMPEMDGQEALRKIREIERDAGSANGDRARIIMTTSLFDVDNVLAGIDDWDAYLVKPIDLRKMAGLLTKLGLA